MADKFYLISACLLGHKVRYDNRDCLVKELVDYLLPDQYVTICPEVSGGLPIPRPAAEIQGGTGLEVLKGLAQVTDIQGQDVSTAFIQELMLPWS